MSKKLIVVSLVAVLLCGTIFAMGINPSSEGTHITIDTGVGTFSCRYNDDYFFEPASEYNPSLATSSYCMIMSSTRNGGGPSESDRTLRLFSQMAGFTDFESNTDYRTTPTVDTLGMAIGSKDIGSGYTLLMINFRWNGYESEWANNFMIGTGAGDPYGNHQGFLNRANDKVFPFINDYLERHDISGKIKIWIGGYSRGGGMSNIVAGLLDTSIIEKRTILNDVTFTKNDIFAYTFEAPGTTCPNNGIDVNNGNYDNIWNIKRPSDVVTMLPCSAWGFKLYGNTIVLPELGFNKEFGKEWNVFSALYAIKGHDMSGLVTTAYAFDDSGLIVSLDNPRYPSLSKDAQVAIDALAKKVGTRENYVNGDAQKSFYDMFSICKGTTGLTNVLKDVGFDLIGSPLTVLEILLALENEDKETFRADIVEPLRAALTKEKLDPNKASDMADSMTYLVFMVVEILHGMHDETMEVPLTLVMNAFYIRDNHCDYDYIYCWLVAEDDMILVP